MPLYDRFLANENGLAVHDISAFCREIMRGNLSQASAAILLGLDDEEALEFESLVKLISVSSEVEAVWDAIYLGQRRIPGYSTSAELKIRLSDGAIKPVDVIKQA